MNVSRPLVESCLKEVNSTETVHTTVNTVMLRSLLVSLISLMDSHEDVQNTCAVVARLTQQRCFFDMADIISRMGDSVERMEHEELCEYIAGVLRESAEQSLTGDKDGVTIQ